MLLLTAVNDFIQIGVQVASVPIDTHSTWVDTTNAGAITPGRENHNTSVAGLLIVAPAPPGATQRNVKSMHMRNKHASLPCGISVYHFDGTTNALIFDIVVPAGRALHYTDQGGFRMM